MRFDHKSGSTVTISDVHAADGVVQRAEELHAALDASDLAGFCGRKVEATPKHALLSRHHNPVSNATTPVSNAGTSSLYCQVEGAATERDADDWRLMQVLT